MKTSNGIEIETAETKTDESMQWQSRSSGNGSVIEAQQKSPTR